MALARWVALACLRLGAILASILIRTVAFLVFGVIGPLCLGMTQEVVRRMMGARRTARGGSSNSLVGNRVSYAVVAGTLWVIGYLVVRILLRFLSWIGALAFSQLAPVLPAWFHLILVVGLIFTVGAVVGALAYGYEENIRSEW